jgi:hypothetical protein
VLLLLPTLAAMPLLKGLSAHLLAVAADASL